MAYIGYTEWSSWSILQFLIYWNCTKFSWLEERQKCCNFKPNGSLEMHESAPDKPFAFMRVCAWCCCVAMWTRIRLPHPHCPHGSHTPRTRLSASRLLLPHSHANLMQKYVKFSILNDAVAGVAAAAAAFLCAADAAAAAVAVATGPTCSRNLWRSHVWIYLLVSHANAAQFQLVMLIKKGWSRRRKHFTAAWRQRDSRRTWHN